MILTRGSARQLAPAHQSGPADYELTGCESAGCRSELLQSISGVKLFARVCGSLRLPPWWLHRVAIVAASFARAAAARGYHLRVERHGIAFHRSSLRSVTQEEPSGPIVSPRKPRTFHRESKDLSSKFGGPTHPRGTADQRIRSPAQRHPWSAMLQFFSYMGNLSDTIIQAAL
jgi:hypothetical protein